MKIKFGIVGLGSIATRFAKALQLVDSCELVGVAARDKIRAVEFAKNYGANVAYENYEDLVKNSDADVIYIALTHNFHYEIAKLCIKYKKGVLCEKPFFTNKKEAVEVFDLAKANDVFIMEAMWTRCLPAFIKAKEWADSKKIGDLKLIDSYFCFRKEYDINNRLYNPDLAGGALYDIGVYVIEFSTGIAQSKLAKMNSVVTKAKSGVDDTVIMQMIFENGILANSVASIAVSVQRDASIFGTKGYIVLNSCCSPNKCQLFDSEHNLLESFFDEEKEGFVHQIKHVVKLISEGKKQSNLIPIEDTLYCADVFDQVKKQCGLL